MERFTTVALVGCPNAGKSTLINMIIGYDLSIITPKAQTTRKNIRGIYNLIDENTKTRTQIVFTDTPGIFNAQNGNNLEKYIVNNAWLGIKNSDSVTFIFSIGAKIDKEQVAIIDRIKQQYGRTVNYDAHKKVKRFIALINKIDIYNKNSEQQIREIEAKTKEIESFNLFEKIYPISAIDGEGIYEMLSYISHHAPEKNWQYNEDLYTDESERAIAEEITREQLYLNLHDELPYSLKVETDLWQDKPDNTTKIYQSILVLKDSQKIIILGRGGSMIKKIGQNAKEKISKVLRRQIHLFLFVKTRESWIKNLRSKQ